MSDGYENDRGDSCYSINWGAKKLYKRAEVVTNYDVDPWATDPFMGTKPKPVPDVFNQVDYREYDFLRFARDESRKPRPVVKQKYIDPLFGVRENTIGQSGDE